MKTVNTTLGPLTVDQLGCVNVHEHIILDASENPHIPEDFDHTHLDKMAQELTDWKAAGGGAIVDASPISVGRNINLLAQVSQSAHVPLIVSTGFHKLSYYPASHWLYSESVEKIIDILVSEVHDGILIDDRHPSTSERSEVRAGIFKLGIDPAGVTSSFQKLLNATANAMRQTSAQLMIHTEPDVPFSDLTAIIDRHAIPPQRVMLCHLGKSSDITIYIQLLEAGYYLEFDEMIRPNPPLSWLAEQILNLFERGHGGQILFAGDLARRSYWTSYDGQPGLGYLLTDLSYQLKNLGFTEEQLNQIWIHNPARYFAGA